MPAELCCDVGHYKVMGLKQTNRKGNVRSILQTIKMVTQQHHYSQLPDPCEKCTRVSVSNIFLLKFTAFKHKCLLPDLSRGRQKRHNLFLKTPLFDTGSLYLDLN